MTQTQPYTNFSPDELRMQLINVLLNVQGAVARRLATLPENNPGQGRDIAWKAYQKDLSLQRSLTEALEKYS